MMMMKQILHDVLQDREEQEKYIKHTQKQIL